MARPACRGRDARFFAVHIRLDVRAQRRNDLSRQSSSQSRIRISSWQRRLVECVGVVAAGHSRHGPYRRRSSACVRRVSRISHVACRVPSASVSLAERHLQIRSDTQWRPELRVRPLRSKNRDRRAAELGSHDVALGVLRRGAHSSWHSSGVCIRVCPCWIQILGLATLLRAGRGDAAGNRRQVDRRWL
jgi:hypothetical protein